MQYLFEIKGIITSLHYKLDTNRRVQNKDKIFYKFLWLQKFLFVADIINTNISSNIIIIEK